MKISQLTTLVDPLQPAVDLLPIIDFDDKSMGSTGTNKKITITQLFTNPTVTGTLRSGNTTTNSLTQGALWLNGGSGALLFDSTGHKRIGWNDGANFNIRAGNYYNGTDDVYAVESGDTGGAAKIALTCDGPSADGEIDFRVAANGIKNNVITYNNIVKIAKDRFTINGTGVNVGIGTANPSVRLDIDGGDIKFKNTDTGSGISTEESNIRLGYSRTGDGLTALHLYSSIGNTATGFATIQKEAGDAGDFDLLDRGAGNIVIHKNNNAGAITFRTGATSGTERMRIGSTGIVFIGNGSTATTPNAATISATGATGPNTAGASLTIRGGISTGNGAGGEVIIETTNAGTAGTTVNASTERMRVTNDGRLLVGHATAIAGTAGVNSYIQVHGLTNATSSAGLYDWQNVAIAGPIFNFNKSKGATVGVRGAVASGDRLGTLVFGGDDGTNFITAASINCLVDGIPATNAMPGRLTFSTTPSGTAAQIERMRISNDGTVFIGNGSAIDAPAAGVISSTGGSGLNTAGASLTIRGGAGTGTGAGGAVIFNTAPAGTAGSTANTAVQRACILPTGQIIVGNATSPFTTRFGGATTPPSNSEYAPVFQILSNTAGSGLQRNTGASLIARFSNDGDGARQFFAKSRNATVGSHTVVSTTDSIGQLSFGGSDGSKIIECARISTIVDVRSIANATAILSGKRYRILTLGNTTTEQWTALGAAASPTPAVGTIFDAIINADSSYGTGTVYLEPETDIVPGAMTFSTGAAASPNERMRITSSGNVGIGTTAPNSKALLHLNSTNSGFLPPAMNNTQRDAMGTVPAGLMIYNNSTGVNAIQFFNGTGWKQLSFTDA